MAEEMNDSTIKFEARVIKPNHCDYSDAYILLTRNIKVEDVAAGTNVGFKSFAQFVLKMCNSYK